jgi:periplasmic mercuric ion binding protein
MKTKFKTTGTILAMIIMVMFVNTAFSQSKKTETIAIKTSAQCNMCKDRLESGLAYEKGVKDVVLDVETKILTVKYNPKTTTPEELRKKISKIGYDADDVPADAKAYEKLPACCKKDAPKH